VGCDVMLIFDFDAYLPNYTTAQNIKILAGHLLKMLLP
jgi:hypothetical protein